MRPTPDQQIHDLEWEVAGLKHQLKMSKQNCDALTIRILDAENALVEGGLEKHWSGACEEEIEFLKSECDKFRAIISVMAEELESTGKYWPITKGYYNPHASTPKKGIK